MKKNKIWNDKKIKINKILLRETGKRGRKKESQQMLRSPMSKYSINFVQYSFHRVSHYQWLWLFLTAKSTIWDNDADAELVYAAVCMMGEKPAEQDALDMKTQQLNQSEWCLFFAL